MGTQRREETAEWLDRRAWTGGWGLGAGGFGEGMRWWLFAPHQRWCFFLYSNVSCSSFQGQAGGGTAAGVQRAPGPFLKMRSTIDAFCLHLRI